LGDDERLLVAGIVGSERQLAGIIDLDDRFPASSSASRLSSLDPVRSLAVPQWPTAMKHEWP